MLEQCIIWMSIQSNENYKQVMVHISMIYYSVYWQFIFVEKCVFSQHFYYTFFCHKSSLVWFSTVSALCPFSLNLTSGRQMTLINLDNWFLLDNLINGIHVHLHHIVLSDIFVIQSARKISKISGRNIKGKVFYLRLLLWNLENSSNFSSDNITLNQLWHCQ